MASKTTNSGTFPIDPGATFVRLVHPHIIPIEDLERAEEMGAYIGESPKSRATRRPGREVK